MPTDIQKLKETAKAMRRAADDISTAGEILSAESDGDTIVVAFEDVESELNLPDEVLERITKIVRDWANDVVSKC